MKRALPAALAAIVTLLASTVAREAADAQARGAGGTMSPAALEFAVGNVEFLLVH